MSRKVKIRSELSLIWVTTPRKEKRQGHEVNVDEETGKVTYMSTGLDAVTAMTATNPNFGAVRHEVAESKSVKENQFIVNVLCDLLRTINIKHIWLRSDQEPATMAIQKEVIKKMRDESMRVTCVWCMLWCSVASVR